MLLTLRTCAVGAHVRELESQVTAVHASDDGGLRRGAEPTGNLPGLVSRALRVEEGHHW